MFKRVQLYVSALLQGYFNMLQARYTMGVHAISRVQYDAEISPLVCVQVSSEFEQDHCKFEVERLKKGASSSRIQTAQSSGGMLIRQRKPLGKDTLVAEGDGTHVTKTTLEEEEPKDPLKWFGILLPSSLRQSQQNFIRGMIRSYLYINNQTLPLL